MEENRPHYFLDFTREELEDFFQAQGIPKYRINQIYRWIFARKTYFFEQMSDLSKELRGTLIRTFCLSEEESPADELKMIPNPSKSLVDRQLPGTFDRQAFVEEETSAAGTKSNATSEKRSGAPADVGAIPLFSSSVAAKHGSPDGTEKLLLDLFDGNRVECVLLRDDRNHRTACISTQVGCAMRCAFCASGMDGFVRNLSRGEILEQILFLNALLPPTERLTHLVVMGTGEPTLNLDSLLSALAEVTSSEGMDLGNRRITLSTVGIPQGIRRLAEANVGYKLAISLHAPDNATRNEIIPQNRVHSISEILAAADDYFVKTGRRVTYEYILIDQINATPRHAQRLVQLLKNHQAIVNLIPYNPVPELAFKTPTSAQTHQFVQILEQGGLKVKIRFRKGDKINAACGQLRRSYQTRSKP